MIAVRVVVPRTGGQRLDRLYRKLPIRIGRHPDNDCQLVHSAVSRFHAELDVVEGQLVLRDLGTRNGVVYPDPNGQVLTLRGDVARLSLPRVSLMMANIPVHVSIERPASEELAPSVAQAARHLMSTCLRSGQPGDDSTREVLDAFWLGLTRLRAALEARGEMGLTDDRTTTALLEWTDASRSGLRLLELALSSAAEPTRADAETPTEPTDPVLT